MVLRSRVVGRRGEFAGKQGRMSHALILYRCFCLNACKMGTEQAVKLQEHTAHTRTCACKYNSAWSMSFMMSSSFPASRRSTASFSSTTCEMGVITDAEN